MYSAVFRIYLISAALILEASAALIVHDSLLYKGVEIAKVYIYRVIHEECHSFRELICHVMLMKKVHMNMCPIFHITGDMRSTIFEIEL